MNGSAPFPEDALERSIREYYERREAPTAPFEQSWAALKTALDAAPGAEPSARQAPGRFNVAVDVAGDDDEVAFILEDTLEDPLEDPMPGDETQPPNDHRPLATHGDPAARPQPARDRHRRRRRSLGPGHHRRDDLHPARRQAHAASRRDRHAERLQQDRAAERERTPNRPNDHRARRQPLVH